MTTLAASPIRYPNTGSREVMTRRGWWLVVLNFLIPGSAQVLAGNRRLGRLGLGSTLALWTLIVAGVAVYLFWPTVIYTLLTQPAVLWGAAIVLVFYAVLWVVLTLDTIRLVRLVRVAPAARAFIAGLATVVMVVLSGGAGYAAYLATATSGFLNSVFVAGPSVPPVDGRYNFLLLGGDAGPDRDGLRPDSITVVSVDAETGKATMIGLPRDLHFMPFPEDSPLHAVYPEGYGAIDGCEVDVCMLNSVYTEVELKSPDMYPNAVAEGSEPGIEAMMDAVSGALGIPLQYYVLVDMHGFAQLIDALGGVDITVTERVPIHADETFTDVLEWIEPGEHHMNSYYALWYARSRHGTSDYDRMQRQRQLQEAILEQFNPANVLTKFQGIAESSADVVRTDIPQSMLGYFVDLALKTKTLPIDRIELIPDNGIDPEDPDYDYIHTMVHDALWPPTPAP